MFAEQLKLDVGSNPTSSINVACICGRAVEGSGLIIRFRKNITGSNPVRCIYMEHIYLITLL